MEDVTVITKEEWEKKQAWNSIKCALHAFAIIAAASLLNIGVDDEKHKGE